MPALKINAVELINNLNKNAYAPNAGCMQNLHISNISSTRQLEIILHRLAGNGMASLVNSLVLEASKTIELPNIIAAFTAMKELSLAKFSELPEEICLLARLQTLKISKNPIRFLPYSFGQLTELRTLEAEGCKLEELHETFGNLKNLRSLNISKNPLRRLPYSFRKLKNLETLWASECYELTIPAGTFSNFKKLETLSVWGVPMEALDGVGDCSNLRFFQTTGLERFQDQLPVQLGNCRSLKSSGFNRTSLLQDRWKSLQTAYCQRASAILAHGQPQGLQADVLILVAQYIGCDVNVSKRLSPSALALLESTLIQSLETIADDSAHQKFFLSIDDRSIKLNAEGEPMYDDEDPGNTRQPLSVEADSTLKTLLFSPVAAGKRGTKRKRTMDSERKSKVLKQDAFIEDLNGDGNLLEQAQQAQDENAEPNAVVPGNFRSPL